MHTLSLSVHDIVDTLLRRGHLDIRIFNQTSMNEGSNLHRYYQSKQVSGYQAEYSLSETFYVDDFQVKVSGKADGLFNDGLNYVIEEIKTTNAKLDDFILEQGEWHLGQAMFYAYMYAKQHSLENMAVQLTYISQRNTKLIKHIKRIYTYEELSSYINDLVIRFVRFISKIQKMKVERDESWRDIQFPFASVRKGQQRMMDFISKAEDENRNVYIEAPTGIGKTVSVLYPSLKRFSEHKADQIFYLTSKNSIKKIAVGTLKLFANMGSKAKCEEFTARDNICFNDKKGHCNPDECPFARNFYDKLLDVILDVLYVNDIIDKEVIKDACYKNVMCPYQFQFEISKFMDVLICDYTYIFNPDVALRFLDEGDLRNNYLLIDECHNLPDRVRELYSAVLTKEVLKEAHHLASGDEYRLVHRNLAKLINLFNEFEIDTSSQTFIKELIYEIENIPEEIVELVSDLVDELRDCFKKYPELVEDKLMDLFYTLMDFQSLLEISSNDRENFCFYLMLNRDAEVIALKIANIASRQYITDIVSRFKSSIFFSATLSPKDYYIDLLGGGENITDRLVLESPFPKENCKVLISTLYSLKYSQRENTLPHIYELIKAAVTSVKGNFFIFCPSYEYLSNLKRYFETDPLEDTDIFFQEKSMNELEKENFLSRFQSDNVKTTIGVLVLGGIFSEGIDLVGDRLIGAIIISVGIPQINFERDKIKEYFDDEENKQKGYLYAYAYPGLNKVFQAAGRVIRTPEDKGFILFIDQRFANKTYKEEILGTYPQAVKAISPSQVKSTLKRFFKEEKV